MNPIPPSPETVPSGPRLDYRQAAPAVLQAMLGLQQAVNRSGLEPSLLELVKLRVSQLNGCAFCIDMHFRDARRAGESEARLYLLDAWAETALYTPRERAALRWAEVLTRLAGSHVTDADFEAVRAHFGEAELAHLTLAIVAINGWNRFGVGFRLPPSLGQ
jgi:AhpD family alkylhydroperoxidase